MFHPSEQVLWQHIEAFPVKIGGLLTLSRPMPIFFPTPPPLRQKRLYYHCENPTLAFYLVPKIESTVLT